MIKISSLSLYYLNFKRTFLLLIGLVYGNMLLAQEVLHFDEFLDWVRMNHPVAKQGDLNLELGRQELRMARGGFDPILYGTQNEKNFNETEYYNKREGGVIVPTMAGVELKGLYEQNRGVYLNSENNVPQGGLMAVGASVNVGQGLFIDPRRLALRQAEIFSKSTEEERRLILNDLYLEATQAYWDWAGAYANLAVYEEGVRLAQIRFEGIKSSFEQGDLPAIDTVEAYTQVLNRVINFQEAQNTFFARTQDLNVFLWDSDEAPIFLNPGTVPMPIDEERIYPLDMEEYRVILAQHPELRLLDYDLDYLEVDRRWRSEQLKPIVKINYNFLSETFNQLEQAPFFENNYKWGLTISSPLFLRRERGALGVTKAKINITAYKRDLRFQKLVADLEKQFNNYQVLGRQLVTFEENIIGLERLLEGEKVKFDMGESSLFLINAREVSLFDAMVVMNSIYVRRNIAVSRVRTAAGLGFDEL
ncbi:TolC family protein [Pleomorphovibrio marinus]|uniref:TolC family protein n=1 Tax=Pleomorphovibrio marinus TaxID=2164132 RepID=UPI001E519079|nr:TolC family protein [Pleomorphovibrio marinus]